MKVRFLVTLGILVGVSGIASAQPYYQPGQSPYAHSRQEAAPSPAVILEQGLQRLIRFVGRQERPDQQQIAAFLEQKIAPYFDFNYMARWAGGRMWVRMSQEQRDRLEKELEQTFLSTLTRRLTSYGGQQVRVLRSKRGRGNEVTVGVAVMNPRGYPARLDFRFYRVDDGWKVFDVSANGSSALVHYRNYFKRQMRQQPRRARGYTRRTY